MWLCRKGMKAVLKPDYYFNISISSSSEIQKGAITRLHTCTESHCEWIGRKLGRNTAEWAGRCQCWVIPLWFPSTWWMCVSSAGLCQHGVFHNRFFTGVRADLFLWYHNTRALFACPGCLESVSLEEGRGCHKLSLVEQAENVTLPGGAWQDGMGTLIIPRCLSEGHSFCKSLLCP